MAKRPAKIKTERVRLSGGVAITPGTHVTMSLTQILIAVGVVATAVLGYGIVVWNQGTQGVQITTATVKLDAVSSALTSVVKDQDAKREQLGKDFLSSQQKIVDEIGDLKTQEALSQQAAKTTNDTLSKISDQLGSLSAVARTGKTR